jgi:hypothetical protein
MDDIEKRAADVVEAIAKAPAAAPGLIELALRCERAVALKEAATIVEEYAEDAEALDDAENVLVITKPKQIRELAEAIRKLAPP